MLSDYNSLNADHLLKTPVGLLTTRWPIGHGMLTALMPAAAHEQLTQVLKDDQLVSADELLNITKGQSRLQSASGCTG